MSKRRATYLLVTEINALNTWGRELKMSLHTNVEQYGVFLVGSALTKPDYRDVDIRQIISDEDWSRLFSTVDIGYYNHVMSLWGQKITGLPIDYQIQSISHEDNKGPKHPIDMLDGYVNGERRQPNGD
ncbi:hypothetical protein [Rhodococcus qingshengii]|uniref:hypothetical protein n=1 Tax=Rhodococcus qingshengii TaxID=334542 RepID=UPI00294296F6|nr:hypothetical protein [Rhodococcus qingshengii]WOI85974.1 hypothetical protein R0122_22610 [Rhodococcus qingshengii]